MDAAAQDPPPPSSPPLGQLLGAERERQGLSRADAAQRLHMSAWQIEALENGDYARLPKGTFLRGFVRNYAKLLGLSADAALVALSHSAPADATPPIVVPTQNIRFDPLGERLSSPYVKAWGVAGVAIALAFAAMYWWLFIRPAPPAATLARKEAVHQPVPQNLAAAPVSAPDAFVPKEAPSEEAQAAPEPPAVAQAPNPAEASKPAVAPKPAASRGVAAMPAPAPATVQEPAAQPRPAKPADVVAAAIVPVQATRPAPGARTLRLRFKGTSWVEIKDRSGKVLMSKLNEPGSETEVSGRPPFSVVVGNAPDVTVLYDDREFPLEPHTRVAVARFTLE